MRNQLIEQSDYLKNEISNLPEGSLLCSKNKTLTKWYLSNGAKPIYIRKKNVSLAQSLALKKLFQTQLAEITQQITILSRAIHSLEKMNIKSEHLLSINSPYYNLLSQVLPKHYFSSQWALENYPTNTNYSEGLIHRCLSGHLVRSKSEVIIANSLFQKQIPFRYECELNLSDVRIYPDFTICHPNTHKIFYWEHFGLMDNSTYRNKTFNKLKLYGDHNIFPSINLVTTFETSKNPIDSGEIQAIINHFFNM